MITQFKTIAKLVESAKRGSKAHKFGANEVVVCNYDKYVFEIMSREKFRLLLQTQIGHTYSEVVFGGLPFRGAFDLDLNISSIDSKLTPFEVAQTVCYELKTIGKRFAKFHLGALDRLVLLNSSRKKGAKTFKISLHIHAPDIIFQCVSDAKAFVKGFNGLSTFKLDPLYKSVFQMRARGGIKEQIILTPMIIEGTTAEPQDPDDYIITPPLVRDIDGQDSFDQEEEYTTSMMDIENVYEIDEKMVVEILVKSGLVDMTNFIMQNTGQNNWRLKRIGTSYCNMCEREHDNDNMRVGVCRSEEGNKMLSLGCFRDLSKTQLINLDGSNTQGGDHNNMSWPNIISEFRSHTLKNKIEAARSDYPQEHHYDTLDQFALASPAKVLCFKASTGSGKTTAMIKMIYGIMREPNTAVLVFCHRKTLTIEMASNLRQHEPVVYNEVLGPVYGQLVIIQIDSLPRLQTEYYKSRKVHIFVDEACGIYDHYFYLEHNRCRNVGMVMYTLMSYAVRIYMMDAYLDPMIWRPIQEFVTSDVAIASNEEKRESHILYKITNNEIEFYTKLKEVACNPDKRIIIIASSLETAEFIKELLFQLKYYDESSLIVYTSRTPEKTIKKHFANINKEIFNYKCIIYTSKVSVGISITVPIDHVFLHCSSFVKGHSAIEVMQMIKRSRCCSNYLLYVSFSPQNVISSYDNFVEWIMNLPMIPYGTMPTCYGEIEASLWFRFMVSICGASHEIRLRSVRNFLMDFLVLLTEYGGRVELGDCLYNEVPTDLELEKVMAAIPNSISEREAELIYNAGNSLPIEPSPFSDEEVGLVDYAAIYNQLVSFYKIKNISEDFIRKYYKQGEMARFRHHLELFTFIPTEDNFASYEDIRSASKTMRRMAGYTKSFGRVLAVYEILMGLGCDSMFGSTKCERQIDFSRLSYGVDRYYSMSPNTNKKVLKTRMEVLEAVRQIFKKYGLAYNKLTSSIDFAGEYYYRMIGTENPEHHKEFAALVSRFNHKVDTGSVKDYDHPVITISYRDFTNLKQYGYLLRSKLF